MAILKCKMCGGDIELSADKTFGTCEFCGSTMTFPKVDDEQRAAMFNRGNHFRRIGEFDKALAVYERIVQEDEADAEAHWCCALCRFGIEYVEDPNTFEYLPTCHRASFDSFLEDVDYLAALEHSDGITKRQYQKDAAKIAEVQRGILATSQNEEPFDVFICYKESEEDGSRTRDSLYAQDIYYQLTEQGRRVFFSRITLEDKAGTEYEPYIFAALNSAKVMVLVTTSADHANAVWVKNEWSRFLSLMRKDRSKLLLPCYRDMDPYDLPEALSVLQSYDMSKIGFIQDLTRGINKVLDGAKPKQTAKETVVIQQQSGYAAPLLERAFMFLEDGDWAKADDFCEQVLNLEPKNALAYLGKLMAELKIRKREQLKDQAQPFDDRNNYQKALRFADGKLKAELSGIITFINDRNETARKEGIYQQALAAIERKNVEGYKEAARLFESISDYKDSADKAKKCHEQAIILPKENTYCSAMALMANGSESDYRSAAAMFRAISGYKDADDKENECLKQAELTKKETDYIKYKQVFEDRAVPRDGNWASAIGNYYVPSSRNASSRFQNWFNAIRGFKILGDYKDSRELAENATEKLYELLCKTLESSVDPQELMVVSDFFTSLIDYRDSAEKAKESLEKKEACKKQMLYSDAIKTMNEAGRAIGNLELAIRKFSSVSGWQNADELAETCRRRIEQIKAQEEATRIEAERKAEAEHRKKTRKQARKKAIVILSIILGVLAILTFGYWIINLKPQQAFNEAMKHFDAEEYGVALESFGELSNYQLNSTVAAESKYWTANTLYKTGQNEKAAIAFAKCGDYKDAKTLCMNCWDQVAIRHTIAAGKYHAVGIKEDGSVVATGDNKYAQCNVRGWKDIISVAAGTEHTVGLKSDGTVVATGDKTNGQCNVEKWNDIVAIAAGDYHTVGLKSDGTLVATGRNLWGGCDVSDMKDIVAIAAGDDTVGVGSDGKVSHAGRHVSFLLSSVWFDIIDVATVGEDCIGLKADGTVVARGYILRNELWKDIRAIAAGEGICIGLKANGTVVQSGYTSMVDGWKNISSIAVGDGFCIGIKQDGTAVAAGNNDYGQCNISEWTDIRVPLK